MSDVIHDASLHSIYSDLIDHYDLKSRFHQTEKAEEFITNKAVEEGLIYDQNALIGRLDASQTFLLQKMREGTLKTGQ